MKQVIKGSEAPSYLKSRGWFPVSGRERKAGEAGGGRRLHSSPRLWGSWHIGAQWGQEFLAFLMLHFTSIPLPHLASLCGERSRMIRMNNFPTNLRTLHVAQPLLVSAQHCLQQFIWFLRWSSQKDKAVKENYSTRNLRGQMTMKWQS